MIIKPALAAAVSDTPAGGVSVRAAMTWLVVIMMINAAISAAYYLRIVATMFLRTEDHHPGHPHPPHPPLDPVFTRPALPITLAVSLSVIGTLLFGAIPPATQLLGNGVLSASRIEGDIPQALPGSPDKAVAASR
jgi:NADH:ubiquinone oxidoreductase subunit 5 (subunit L)/multisubunit Na+/H+ antiporter MnhA subunit